MWVNPNETCSCLKWTIAHYAFKAFFIERLDGLLLLSYSFSLAGPHVVFDRFLFRFFVGTHGPLLGWRLSPIYDPFAANGWGTPGFPTAAAMR